MREVKSLSLVQLEKIVGDDDYVVGYCELHEKPVNQRTFEYKGCWTCWDYFRWGDWFYIDVRGAAEMYGVCRNTIYMWIKQGKLKARLFVMGRRNANVPRRFYAILPNQHRPRMHRIFELQIHASPLLQESYSTQFIYFIGFIKEHTKIYGHSKKTEESHTETR